MSVSVYTAAIGGASVANFGPGMCGVEVCGTSPEVHSKAWEAGAGNVHKAHTPNYVRSQVTPDLNSIMHCRNSGCGHNKTYVATAMWNEGYRRR